MRKEAFPPLLSVIATLPTLSVFLFHHTWKNSYEIFSTYLHSLPPQAFCSKYILLFFLFIYSFPHLIQRDSSLSSRRQRDRPTKERFPSPSSIRSTISRLSCSHWSIYIISPLSSFKDLLLVKLWTQSQRRKRKIERPTAPSTEEREYIHFLQRGYL